MRYLSVILVGLGLIAVQALIGGVKLVFSLPGYIILSLGVLAAVFLSRKLLHPPLVCAFAALALAGWVVARALTSPVPYLARTDLLMVLAAAAVYLVTVIAFRDQRARWTLVGLLLAFTLFQVFVGARQFKMADDFMCLPGILRPSYGWRASGFYICPNHLAGLLEMVGLLALGIAFWSDRRPFLRVLAAFCALGWFGGVGITGSRGGYLSVIFGLGVFAVLSLWVVWLTKRGGFFVTLAAVLLGATVIIGGGFLFMSQSDSIRDRMAKIYDPTNMRVFIWKGELEQYHLQPLTGTGSGTTLYLARQFRAPEVQNDPQHAHDDYLELLAEYGLIGAALVGLFLLVHVVSGLAGLRRIVIEQIRQGTPSSSNDLALTVGALSALGALLFHSLLDFNMHIPGNALVVAFLCGIMAAPVTTENVLEPEKALRPAGLWRWSMAALALVFLGLCARFLPGEIFAEKARMALRDDRNSEALAFARQGIAWEKNNPFLYGYLGEALHFLTLTAPDRAAAQSLHEDALEAYAQGLKIYPHDTGLLLKEAQVYDVMGRYPEAEQVFQRLFQLDPMFGNIYAYYGLHWQLQRHIQTAERCYSLANRLGERDISGPALQNIDRLKKDPVSQSLLGVFPDVPVDLPAERLLPKP
ncbi:MAG TPA: O-antigen ligase family protein [Chthoniobacter sp.]